MTTVHTERFLTLAVHPYPLGFGWVLCQGPFELLEHGLFTVVEGDKNAACVRKLEKLIARLRPAELVLEAFGERSGRSERIRALCLQLVAVGVDRGLFVEAHTREAVIAAFEVVGARTREQIANVIAQHFPGLVYRLPPPRKTLTSEDKRLAIFNAAAVVIAHFHNGATALLAERGSAA